MPEHHHNLDDHEQLRNQQWEIWLDRYQENLLALFRDGDTAVLKNENFNERLRAPYEAASAISGRVIDVGCIDDGTPRFFDEEGTAALQIGIGGSGILMSEEQRDRLATFLAEQIVAGKKVRLHPHQECGAAKKASKNKEINKEEDFDAEATQFTQELLELIKKKVLELDPTQMNTEIENAFVSIEEMTRPPGFHPAFGIYLETTGRFNPARPEKPSVLDRLPPMFELGAKFLDAKHSTDNIGVALEIAFGDHGFADKFTKEHPFVIALIVDASPGSQKIAQELKSNIQDFLKDHKHKDKIVVRTLDITGLGKTV